MKPSRLYPSLSRLRLSYSSMKTFHSCPRKFEFSKLYNLVRDDNSGHAALVGHLLHQTLAIYLQTQDRDAAYGYLVTHYPINTYKEYSASDPRSLEACFATISDLISHPIFERLELSRIEVNGEIREAIEVPFEIDLGVKIGNLPLSFIGYIDFICWDHFLQRHIILDLKTTRRPLPHMRAKFKFDEQMLPYSLVLETVLGQRFQEVDVTYLVTYIDILYPEIELLTYTKTRNDVKEWAQSLYVLYTELQLYYKHRWFPRRSDACAGYGICQFTNHCESRDVEFLHSYFLSGGYLAEEREFNPWFMAQLELA